jgi:hypothetical protein
MISLYFPFLAGKSAETSSQVTASTTTPSAPRDTSHSLGRNSPSFGRLSQDVRRAETQSGAQIARNLAKVSGGYFDLPNFGFQIDCLNSGDNGLTIKDAFCGQPAAAIEGRSCVMGALHRILMNSNASN